MFRLCRCTVLRLAAWAGTETIPRQSSRALIIQQTCGGSFSPVSKPMFSMNTHFEAFFEIYTICTLMYRATLNFCKLVQYCFSENQVSLMFSFFVRNFTKRVGYIRRLKKYNILCFVSFVDIVDIADIIIFITVFTKWKIWILLLEISDNCRRSVDFPESAPLLFWPTLAEKIRKREPRIGHRFFSYTEGFSWLGGPLPSRMDPGRSLRGARIAYLTYGEEEQFELH